MSASGLTKTAFILLARAIYILLISLKKDLLQENNKRIIYNATPAYKKISFRLMQYIGILTTSFSVSAIVFAYGPLLQAQDSLVISQAEPVPVLQAQPSHQGLVSEPNNFEISIPKLEVNSIVIPNIDPTNKEEYLPAMLDGVLHASSSSFPDEPGVAYLFAHSTNSPLYIKQFNAVFYRLRELEIGDKITINYKGKIYEYEVEDKQVVETNDTYWISNPVAEKKLVLQTSHPPGTIWKRLLIIASPI